MRSNPEQKRTHRQQLPPPYDRLSRVLPSLKGQRSLIPGRTRANVTTAASYIAAAMRLIQRHLGPNAKRLPGDLEDPDSMHRPLLNFLSQREVAREVGHNPPPLLRRGSVATLRQLWPRHAHFIADVLRFGLEASHFPAKHKEEAAEATRAVLSGPEPVRGLQRLCFWYINRLLATPAFRLELVAVAEADGDPVITEAIFERHRQNASAWREPCEKFLSAHGLRLRHGVTLEDCGVILTALAEGLAVRALGDPSAPVVDFTRQRSLLGTAAMMMIMSCVVMADGGDASLEDAVHALMTTKPEDRASRRDER